jgi:hypothetical protein
LTKDEKRQAPSLVLAMEESAMINQEKRSAIQSICERLNKHCGEIKKLSDALGVAQNKNPKFSINQPFDSAKSRMFPKLDINFETYYTVVISLLNLIYQMQCMKIYCQRLLGS